jgi:adenylate cyclase
VALTQLFLQINDKFGQGILWDFIRGKYHSPREEERVFMFVDLMNSTHIAEKIGNENYHHLLKEFFTDITRPILHNKGEIYQYVGDEVVISWKMKNGIENNQCLKCFFDMRKTMADFGSRYLKKFGLIPEFKAGVHFGKVIAGEIGIIKRDITFSGDVLNTAARIQGKCNEYKVNFLASDALLERMNVDRQFYRIPMGRIELKGKENAVPLSTLQPR